MSTYKFFPNSFLIREWDKLIKLKREEVVETYEEWKEIDEENQKKHKEMYEEKQNAIKEVEDFLVSKGIEVYNYKKGGFFPKKSGYKAWFKNNIVEEISKKYPYYSNSIPTAHMGEYEIDGIKVYNNQSPTNLVELYDRITRDYNYKMNEARNKNQLLIKSIEYATNHNIDIELLSTAEIIKRVDEIAKENYLEENVPDGTEVYLKNECYDCSSYIVGEYRCSCGNRRISITVDGNLIDGYYYYPEAH